MANANIPPSTALIQHTLDDFIIEQRPRDGYLNATAMCRAAGKRINDYAVLDNTQAFLHALAADLGLQVIAESITGYPVIDREVVAESERAIWSHSESKRSGAETIATEIPLIQSSQRGVNQGTWIHPRVAIHLAQWLSPEFSVLVSKWVLDWMTTGHAPVNAGPSADWAAQLEYRIRKLEQAHTTKRRNPYLPSMRSRVSPDVQNRIVAMRSEGLTFSQIADSLMLKKIASPDGLAQWHRNTVRRIIILFANKKSLN